jgi:DnaJ-class molecular chaperone
VISDDPYDLLGLTRGASKAEINRAFRKLAKQHHPDLNHGDAAAEEYFKRLTAAYDQLTSKAALPVEAVSPTRYDDDYVAELESRYRAQRDEKRKSEGKTGGLAAFFKNKFRAG